MNDEKFDSSSMQRKKIKATHANNERSFTSPPVCPIGSRPSSRCSNTPVRRLLWPISKRQRVEAHELEREEHTIVVAAASEGPSLAVDRMVVVAGKAACRMVVLGVAFRRPEEEVVHKLAVDRTWVVHHGVEDTRRTSEVGVALEERVACIRLVDGIYPPHLVERLRYLDTLK